MTTTVAAIIARATDANVANRGASLVPADSIAIQIVDTAQADVFVRLAADNRVFYQTDELLTSTASAAGSARTVNLATLTQSLLRLLRVERDEDDLEISVVDVRDTSAEYAPRATVSGLTLREVYPDWDTSDPGTVDLRIYYVHGAPALEIAGATTQTVTLPDQFCDLLVNRFARYLATKDQGRDPKEVEQLDADYESRYLALVSYLDNLAGAQALGVAVPVSGRKE